MSEESAKNIVRSDWVLKKGSKVIGYVKRVAKNGSWADVLWHDPELGKWVKRVDTSDLIIVTTIPIENMEEE